MPLRICFATAEMAPFAKAGGLGDVSGALVKYLHAAGHDIRLFLPAYAGIPLFAMMRDETYFLPHFLRHYRRLGVGSFAICCLVPVFCGFRAHARQIWPRRLLGAWRGACSVGGWRRTRAGERRKDASPRQMCKKSAQALLTELTAIVVSLAFAAFSWSRITPSMSWASSSPSALAHSRSVP